MDAPEPMPDLGEYERIVFNMIRDAARRNQPCPSNLDFEMELGCNSSSIPPTIIQILERKGIIAVTRYQRAREVTILATGERTARHPDRRTEREHVPRGSRSNEAMMS